MQIKPFIIVLAFILISILLITKAPKTTDLNPPENGASIQLPNVCKNAGGNYLPEFNECENIGAEQCTALGGTFNECASACRNDPSAEFCTMQCVQVCKF